VALTSSIPTVIGTVRKPTMPMSWKSGNHDTITSCPVSSRAACTIAPMLACKVAVGDADGLGLRGRAAGELQQGGVVLARDVRVRGDGFAVEVGEQAARDAVLGQDPRPAPRRAPRAARASRRSS
jgi:hypothetical protein